LFAAAAISTVLAFRRLKPPAQDLPGLAEHVRQARPQMHLLPVHPRYGVAAGFYLSTRATTTEEAAQLPCDPDHKDLWQGVALCQQRRSDLERESWVSQWGDGAISLPGGIVVVGDPQIVQLFADLAER
jgi:hypothetical protein